MHASPLLLQATLDSTLLFLGLLVLGLSFLAILIHVVPTPRWVRRRLGLSARRSRAEALESSPSGLAELCKATTLELEEGTPLYWDGSRGMVLPGHPVDRIRLADSERDALHLNGDNRCLRLTPHASPPEGITHQVQVELGGPLPGILPPTRITLERCQLPLNHDGDCEVRMSHPSEEPNGEWSPEINEAMVAWLQGADLTPYGPLVVHEGCCILQEGGEYCDCKASDASDLDWGVGL